MGLVINTLHRMDGYQDKHFGSVTHNGHTFDAVLFGEFQRLQSILHRGVTAEYQLAEIISTEHGLAKNDTLSGIFPLDDGQIAVDGSIHNEIQIDDGLTLFDIYIQNGADFLAVTSDEVGQKLAVNSRIRIVGKGLHVYPTFS